MRDGPDRSRGQRFVRTPEYVVDQWHSRGAHGDLDAVATLRAVAHVQPLNRNRHVRCVKAGQRTGIADRGGNGVGGITSAGVGGRPRVLVSPRGFSQIECHSPPAIRASVTLSQILTGSTYLT